MTDFWREGYVRWSKNGVEHYVEGHWVRREDWSRNASGSQSRGCLDILREWRALGSRTARSVVPNAECPACGADVFFYRNEFGSRVWFDELGPPWPKHPCTSVLESPSRRRRPDRSLLTAPVARRGWELDSVRSLLQHVEAHELSLPADAAAPKGWITRVVESEVSSLSHRWLVLTRSDDDASGRMFVSHDDAAEPPSQGAIVFVRGTRLSFFDRKHMQVREVLIQRVDGAAAFFRMLAGGG